MHLRSLIGAAVVVLAAFVAGPGGSPASVSAVASIVVNSAADDTLANLVINGKCDLREAIIAANTNAPAGNCPKGDAGADTITFNIDGPGPHTINVTATLPTITQQVTIDGSTAEATTGCAPPRSLSIIIHGAVGSVNGLTLGSAADGSIIRGLVINGFGGVALAAADADEVTIDCNHIGTNREGTAAVPNSYGVTIGDDSVLGSSADPVRGMNVISGSNAYGVGLSDDAKLYGNHIGTNLAGTAAIPNGTGVDVLFATSGATIGSSSFAGNLISGNLEFGILVTVASGITISGNRIGTDVTGTGNLGNGGPGIALVDQDTRAPISSNIIGFNAGPPIDIGNDGPTANDAGDGDNGPNLRQNYPVITAATPTLVTANTNGFGPGPYIIEFFSSATCDGARTPIGFRVDVAPDSTVVFDGEPQEEQLNLRALPAAGFITATATYFDLIPTPLVYTSEFSPCIEIVPVIDPYDVDCDTDHDSVDALAIMRFLAGLAGAPEPAEPCDADIDNDQGVDLSDAVALRLFLALEP